MAVYLVHVVCYTGSCHVVVPVGNRHWLSLLKVLKMEEELMEMVDFVLVIGRESC